MWKLDFVSSHKYDSVNLHTTSLLLRSLNLFHSPPSLFCQLAPECANRIASSSVNSISSECTHVRTRPTNSNDHINRNSHSPFKSIALFLCHLNFGISIENYTFDVNLLHRRTACHLVWNVCINVSNAGFSVCCIACMRDCFYVWCHFSMCPKKIPFVFKFQLDVRTNGKELSCESERESKSEKNNGNEE